MSFYLPLPIIWWALLTFLFLPHKMFQYHFLTSLPQTPKSAISPRSPSFKRMVFRNQYLSTSRAHCYWASAVKTLSGDKTTKYMYIHTHSSTCIFQASTMNSSLLQLFQSNITGCILGFLNFNFFSEKLCFHCSFYICPILICKRFLELLIHTPSLTIVFVYFCL